MICVKCGKTLRNPIAIGRSVFGVKAPYFCKHCQLEWHKIYTDTCKKENLTVLYGGIWKQTFLKWLENPNLDKERVVFT